MKDVYTELVEGIQSIDARLTRMEAAQLDSGKLVDRLIEMAMVVKGQGDQAVLHRAQASRDPKGFEAWHEELDEKEETWPPEGCDVMDVRG